MSVYLICAVHKDGSRNVVMAYSNVEAAREHVRKLSRETLDLLGITTVEVAQLTVHGDARTIEGAI